MTTQNTPHTLMTKSLTNQVSKHTNSPTISFEFFPPKTAEGMANLSKAQNELAPLNPDFFSITFGAGGSTQEGSLAALSMLQLSGCTVAPHLSCIGSTKETIKETLLTYQQKGVNRIVALRGDLPSGMGSHYGDFEYASELVEFIRQETNDYFYIYVAAYPEYHPQASSPTADLFNFARKVKAGANAAITQYFFNTQAYFSFVESAGKAGVHVPIIPGIMPITNCQQLLRFSKLCGAEIPRWIHFKLEEFKDDISSLHAFGNDVIIQMCDQLLKGNAPSLHFYTLNKPSATLNICKQLFNK